MRNPIFLRIVAIFVGAAVGAFFGIAGTIAHTVMWEGFPVGLVTAMVSCVALLLAIRALTGDTFIVLGTGIGMLIALILLSGGGPGGSILVPDAVNSHIWMWGIVVVVAVVALWPKRRQPSHPEAVDVGAHDGPGAAAQPKLEA